MTIEWLKGQSKFLGARISEKSSDFLLVFVIVSIIALMILPLPLFVLDFLVATNIAIGIMLVLMAIYIQSPLQFSAFPSVILISTLFRLALSVATTRVILIKGDAGNIIDTFGELVAGGNIVVGLVVFLIITLVQFLVIAKGAERVAEVCARFSLDAMPGKQMSIDSDLRSGLIDKAEARKKREDLELESKLHGSMDGAMKFVKGDAIAGIVIIIINLLGGLSIGVFQQGLDAGVAMSKYSILTIGDGMVAQIPALFGAMSAGLIVTRVGGDSDAKNLGDSIHQQITAIPQVLLVSGVMSWLFAFVPGFPSVVFFVLGTCLIATGLMFTPVVGKRIKSFLGPWLGLKEKESYDAIDLNTESGPQEKLSHAIPIHMELPASLAAGGNGQVLQSLLQRAVDDYQQHSGLPLPEVSIHWKNDVTEWAFFLFEVPVATGEKLSNEDLVAGLSRSLKRNAHLFVGIQETSSLLHDASNRYPLIVEKVSQIPIHNLANIFRNLIQEDIPIRNIRNILEALVNGAQHEKDVSNLSELARISLSREISHRYAPGGKLKAIVLSGVLEEQLARAVSGKPESTGNTLDPRLIDLIKSELVSAIGRHKDIVVVTPITIRRQLRQLISDEAFDTPVLSYSELIPSIERNIVETVDLPKLPESKLKIA